MKDFRKLQVWEKAHQLALTLYHVTASFPRDETYGLTTQIRRSASSIPSNIAEGCGRDWDAELLRRLRLIGLFGQRARAEGLAALDRVAMHTLFGHASLGTLEYTRISSVSGRLTIPPWMDSHADDRASWEAFQGKTLFECLPGTLHLADPNKSL